ncbi:6-O-methylguanine DNA methyltransferase, DNA binding domain protein [Dictyocaulus viviparus]|uniref:Methylated-DNA--protein-cysteine methyltransferase n=1 Tax=Dictyocaulus viviparus TaxID=29172 RepID=A0A0D8XZH8_DICVI|nr:6-O-methylguanine DNA methyltransferase, DNA binding domain protein [Dictyocaulus viviparus]
MKVLLAEIDSQLCALSFIIPANKLSAIKDLSRLYPSIEFNQGEISNARNVLRVLSGETVEDIPISKFVFERCSVFRKNVYTELLRIPRGTTKTYSEVACLVGRPTASRAVARACSENVLAVIIPCHRVVALDGSLCGYKWGIDIKRQLLNMESK